MFFAQPADPKTFLQDRVFEIALIPEGEGFDGRHSGDDETDV